MDGFPEGSLGEGWAPIIGEISEGHLINILASPPGAPIFLCSDGGDTGVGRALADLVRLRRVVAAGACASAAIPLLAAGRERQCLSATKFLWHEPYLEPDGSQGVGDLTVARDDIQSYFDWANRLLGRRTKKSPRFWANLGAGAGTLFSSGEAQEWGLVEKVVRRL